MAAEIVTRCDTCTRVSAPLPQDAPAWAALVGWVSCVHWPDPEGAPAAPRPFAERATAPAAGEAHEVLVSFPFHGRLDAPFWCLRGAALVRCRPTEDRGPYEGTWPADHARRRAVSRADQIVGE